MSRCKKKMKKEKQKRYRKQNKAATRNERTGIKIILPIRRTAGRTRAKGKKRPGDASTPKLDSRGVSFLRAPPLREKIKPVECERAPTTCTGPGETRYTEHFLAPLSACFQSSCFISNLLDAFQIISEPTRPLLDARASRSTVVCNPTPQHITAPFSLRTHTHPICNPHNISISKIDQSCPDQQPMNFNLRLGGGQPSYRKQQRRNHPPPSTTPPTRTNSQKN